MNYRFTTTAAAILAVSLIVPSGFASDNAKPVKRQTTTKATKAKPSKAPEGPSVEEQIQALRQELAGLINSLKSDLAAKDAQLKKAEQAAAEAQAAADKANAAATAGQQAVTENTEAVSTLKSTVEDMRGVNASIAQNISDNDTKAAKKSELSDLAFGKVKIGATFFGDFSSYTDTAFAPVFIDNAYQEGPGNHGYNTFEATRVYINMIYTPSDYVSLRITPDIYRQINSNGTNTADSSTANGSEISQSEGGNLVFRLKYAYVDFNKLFDAFPAFKKDKLTFGQTQNPLVDWEEGLTAHRYTYLVPWNYMGMSSAYVGARLHGPIELNGKEYLDYDFGAFTTTAYNKLEQNDKKMAMARLTWYPFGTRTDRTGFGLTFFENYGYNTKTADTKSYALNRMAILGHYQSTDKGYEIVGEYDLGHNSITYKNLFSGSIPTSSGKYATLLNAVKGVLPDPAPQSAQQGYAFMGTARVGKKSSPLSVWGLFQEFEPNTKFKYATTACTTGVTCKAFDFYRTLGGISYKVSKNFDFSVGDENFHWVNNQSFANGGDTNAIVMWTQYSF
jgi:hypothetical protein